MGADGDITIYNADAVDKAGLTDYLFGSCCNIYEHTLKTKTNIQLNGIEKEINVEIRVYHIYNDTEGHNSWIDNIQIDETKEAMLEKCLIDVWEVWT